MSRDLIFFILKPMPENRKIAGRNINNFRYADDTTLMTESEERRNISSRSERGE